MDDLTGLLALPLVKGIPTAILIGVLAWVVTEAGSFIVPVRWRPVLAVVCGAGLGYLFHRSSLVDFGAGPDGWLRALVFGLLGGAMAPMAHPLLRDKPPFSWLTKLTPSAAPSTQGGTGS